MSIDAEKARQLTREAREFDLTFILKKTEEAARQGETSIAIDIQNTKWAKYFSEVKKRLETLGFTVSRNTYSDFRDSWDNINIGWGI